MKRLLMLVLLLGCAQEYVPVQDAQAVAEERVMQDYNYRAYNGHNLRLEAMDHIQGGYFFSFRYDIESGLAPSNVNGYRVSMNIINLRAHNFSITELTEASSYFECEERGYEILYPDCEGCKQQCITPEGKVFNEPECPPKNVDCMPVVSEDNKLFCETKYREWAEENCDVFYTD
jgi:hypothetical protein